MLIVISDQQLHVPVHPAVHGPDLCRPLQPLRRADLRERGPVQGQED